MLNNEYKVVYMPNHHRAFSNGCVFEHILVAEKKIGRELKPEEVVHHKDSNKKNNFEDNLIVFASNSDHISYHNGCTYYLDEEGIAHSSKKNFLCKNCGLEIKYWHKNKTGMCINCFNEKIKRKRVPTRDELKTLIRNNNFVEVGKIFSVSDNAIRKWCVSYNLPRKATEIRKISDLDWENI